jgi:hypothetical protein
MRGFSESAVIYFGAISFCFLKMPERKMHAHPRSRVTFIVITAKPLTSYDTNIMPLSPKMA